MSPARRRWFLFVGSPVAVLTLGLALVAGGVAAANEPAPVASTGGEAEGDTATLTLANRPIVVLRALGAASAGERVEAAQRRFAEATAGYFSGDVTTREVPEGVLLLIGARPLFLLTPADLGPLPHRTLGEAATEAAGRVRLAVGEARETRSLGALLRAVGFAALATLLFVLAVRLVVAARRRILARARRLLGDRTRGVAVAGYTLLTRDQITGGLRWAVELPAWGLGLLSAHLWLTYVLTRFPYTRPWGEALGAYLITTVADLTLGALRAVPGLFTVALILLAARLLVRYISGFFSAVETGAVVVAWLHPETAIPTRRIAVALVWIFAVVVAYPYLPGSGSDVFKGVSVLLGIVISLGSTGIVNQAMSGLALMFSRAFRPGDFVRIGDIEGVVIQLGTLSTKLRTYRQEELTIPNAVVLGTTTRNYSRLSDGAGAIVSTTVTIGYDAPWRQVHALLLAAAARTPGLRQGPPPRVLQRALSDFYVEYELLATLENGAARPDVLSALHGAIQDAFNEAGVQIMSPHFESQPEEAVVVPKDKWHLPTAADHPPTRV